MSCEPMKRDYMSKFRYMAMWGGVGLALSSLVACAPTPRPGARCPVSRTEITSATVAAPARSAPAASTRATAPQTRAGFEVRSACPERVRLFYGEQPGESSGTLVQLAPGDESFGPRRDDGTQRVWLVDDRERAIGDVTVSASTRKVEVDAACAGLRAL